MNCWFGGGTTAGTVSPKDIQYSKSLFPKRRPWDHPFLEARTLGKCRIKSGKPYRDCVAWPVRLFEAALRVNSSTRFWSGTLNVKTGEQSIWNKDVEYVESVV